MILLSMRVNDYLLHTHHKAIPWPAMGTALPALVSQTTLNGQITIALSLSMKA